MAQARKGGKLLVGLRIAPKSHGFDASIVRAPKRRKTGVERPRSGQAGADKGLKFKLGGGVAQKM